MTDYDDAKEKIIQDLEDYEGDTIMEDMLKERREWVTEYRKSH